MRDVTKALGGRKYRERFRLVTSQAEADLALEITFRGEQPTNQSTQTGGVEIGGAEASTRSAQMEKTLKATVRITSTTEFTVSGGLWSKIAEGVAESFSQWTAENQRAIDKALAR